MKADPRKLSGIVYDIAWIRDWQFVLYVRYSPYLHGSILFMRGKQAMGKRIYEGVRIQWERCD
ncbi:MAG: hypothetical protein KatS3mg081_0017 [Gemmatimonadales bacterium]|nr:MAG: hypothetical protein KatS3mg081_0017 [Gemmatimonadales bacterium]